MKLINPKTAATTGSFIKNPSHALILHGERGAGQNILALEIAAETSQTPIKELQTANRIMILESQDNKNISLDQIKPIKPFFERKISKKGRLARIVIIQTADLMTLEAQNSLLKILEGELVSENLIILSCANLEGLIGPIHSRCQKIVVLPISLSQIYKSYPNHDKGELKKIFHMTRGLSENFANQISQGGLEKAELKQAKLFLSGNRAEKLRIVVNLINNKDLIEDFVVSLQNLAKAGLSSSRTKESALKWSVVLKKVNDCQIKLQHSVSAKLALLDLSLKI